MHKGPRDPRLEKLRDFRRGRKAVRFDRECGRVRRLHRRKYRRSSRVLVKTGRFEALVPFRGTEGWVTW